MHTKCAEELEKFGACFLAIFIVSLYENNERYVPLKPESL